KARAAGRNTRELLACILGPSRTMWAWYGNTFRESGLTLQRLVDRPAALARNLLQAGVGIDRERVRSDLQHGEVVDRVTENGVDLASDQFLNGRCFQLVGGDPQQAVG